MEKCGPFEGYVVACINQLSRLLILIKKKSFNLILTMFCSGPFKKKKKREKKRKKFCRGILYFILEIFINIAW